VVSVIRKLEGIEVTVLGVGSRIKKSISGGLEREITMKAVIK